MPSSIFGISGTGAPTTSSTRRRRSGPPMRGQMCWSRTGGALVTGSGAVGRFEPRLASGGAAVERDRDVVRRPRVDAPWSQDAGADTARTAGRGRRRQRARAVCQSGGPGLRADVSYDALIRAAFQPAYWSSPAVVDADGPRDRAARSADPPWRVQPDGVQLRALLRPRRAGVRGHARQRRHAGGSLSRRRRAAP